MSALTGQSFGRYHILEQLGEGGMATVYKAYDTRLETDVAVKVIRTENLAPTVVQAALKRFEREAKALARLTHPNIVKVTDYGEHEGMPYIVMEYLPGGTLKKSLGDPIPWQEAARTLLPIARALDFAHRQNMIHRDVKPSNILITSDGEPMLTDFGIAKILDMQGTADLTGTGMGIGTPEYMAPEQWIGGTTMQSDQYSLAVTFYEMVTGRKPYGADTPAAVFLKQSTEPLPRPSQFAKSVPEAVEKLLIKALAKEPADRYQNMSIFAGALEALLNAPPAESVATTRMERATPAQVASARTASGPATPMPVAPAPAVRRESQPVVARPPALDRTVNARTPSQPISVQHMQEKSAMRYWTIGIVAFALLLCLCLIAAIMWQSDWIRISLLESPASAAPLDGPTAVATPVKTGDEFVDGRGVKMLLVPAGSFKMGSDKNDADEKPFHEVTLDAYYMDVYEATNKLYRACASAGACAKPGAVHSSSRENYYSNSEFDNYPVVNVDWDMANAFCAWRGARLPTEAEWEKAARGTDGRVYPWGAAYDLKFANLDGYDTEAVGSFPAGISPFGMYDMAGNVWEWVADWYSDSYYQIAPVTNPLGPDSGEFRILRGGSWYYDGYGNRSSVRVRVLGSYTTFVVGFRCARTK